MTKYHLRRWIENVHRYEYLCHDGVWVEMPIIQMAHKFNRFTAWLHDPKHKYERVTI